jgi:magnesium transporter
MSDLLLGELKDEKFDPRELAERLRTFEPADGAVALEILPPEAAAGAAQLLPPSIAADMLRRVEPERAEGLFALMVPQAASDILSAMAPDDRVDVLRQCGRKLHDSLVRDMAPAEAAETRQLEQYSPHSAGGIMTTEVTALPKTYTVEQAVAELRQIHQKSGQLFYVYVVDDQRRLVGVLSMRNLVLAETNNLLEAILIPNVKSVPATMDREEVARLMRASRFLALPVVDEDGRLAGLITLDDVVDVIHEEATEDVQRMFGAGAEERLSSSWHFSFSKRIWWLQVNLGTAFLAGLVVAVFGATMQRLSFLAIYIPVVSSMGSNAGAQAMSVAIRGITQGRPNQKLLRHVLNRETIVGFLSGVVIGVTTAIIAMIWQYHHGVALGIVVGISIVVTQTLACITGAAIPFIMRQLGFDPAQSAIIFISTITDIAGFALLLGLATICAGWMR